MRLFIYVEGLSEEIFVNRRLQHHLRLYGWRSITPIGAATSLDPQSQRGGLTNWRAVEADLRSLFASEPDGAVRFTTLWDYYRTPDAFPGITSARVAAAGSDRAAIVEAALASHFAEPRFEPYIQMHEFEALVLAALDGLKPLYSQHAPAIEALQVECERVGNCEAINDGPDRHPAQRIANAVPGFLERKAQDGPIALLAVDLETIRRGCPRFNAWLHRLEVTGSAQP